MLDAVLVVPASLFQVAAGAVFGLWLGCLIAWVGCTLGMVATFIMGRCCRRDSSLSLHARHGPSLSDRATTGVRHGHTGLQRDTLHACVRKLALPVSCLGQMLIRSLAHALRRADRYLLRDWVKQKAVNSSR